jgi:exonuclease VII small subunit
METLTATAFSYDLAIEKVRGILKELGDGKCAPRDAVALIKSANQLMKYCDRDLKLLETELNKRVEDCL